MKSLALVALPRTDPGKRERYVRKNGPWTLVMTAGGEKGRLPYGNLPRLLLAWVCSEAVRTKRRHLLLGHSLAHFMRELGVESSMSGGTTGIRTRLQTQMQRLFSTAVELTYTTDEGVHRVADHITTRMDLWWNTRRPTEPVLWESSVTLGQDFFDEIMRDWPWVLPTRRREQVGGHPGPALLTTGRSSSSSTTGWRLKTDPAEHPDADVLLQRHEGDARLWRGCRGWR